MSEPEENDIRDAASLRRTTGATLEDIIKKTILVHEHLEAHYSILYRQAEREHMRLLFEWSMSHEARMLESLKETLASVSQATLKRWFMYSPEVPLDELSSHVNIHVGIGRKDLVEETQRIYEAIDKVYAPSEGSAVPEDLREVLGSLRDLERQHAVEYKRAAFDE